MNTFKQTFYKYKFVNFTVILFYTFIQILSIFLFPRWLYGDGRTYNINPYILSATLSLAGLLIILFCANETLTNHSKNIKIIYFIGIIVGIVVYLILGVIQEIYNFTGLLKDYNEFNWSSNLLFDTREHNVLSFFFIAPIFCYLMFLTASILYIKELIKVHKQNKQATDTTTA